MTPFYSRSIIKRWSSQKKLLIDKFEVTVETLIEFCRLNSSSSNNESGEIISLSLVQMWPHKKACS